jgi:serine-type D-Ala-D-Ala carboxypeptidase (penicillin-binding protein 5/6)
VPWPSEATWSTPANLITLGRYAMSYPVSSMIVGQASYSLPAGDGHHAYTWQNTNPLIGVYQGATGIKTGDTKAAWQLPALRGDPRRRDADRGPGSPGEISNGYR